MKRRSFLKVVGGGIGAGGLTVGPPAGSPAVAGSQEGAMPRRLLGRTGMDISIVSFAGLALIHQDQEPSTASVHDAFERGVNFFDVAPSFGRGDAEIKLGNGLWGLDRSRYFLANKTRLRDKEGARKELELSLERAHTDHFDSPWKYPWAGCPWYGKSAILSRVRYSFAIVGRNAGDVNVTRRPGQPIALGGQSAYTGGTGFLNRSPLVLPATTVPGVASPHPPKGNLPMRAFQSPRLSENSRWFLMYLAAAAVWCITWVPAWGCNVPVFRYALERWAPDPYYLGVFHTADDEQAVSGLLATLEDRPVNVFAEGVDVDELEEDDWRLSGIELDRENLPWAVMRYPPRGPQTPPIAWSGQLDEETLDLLTNSSVRQEVVRRLLTGESAVWVFVESGDPEKDETARKTVERYLAEAKSKLRIPGVEELDYSPTDPDAAPAPTAALPAFDDMADAIPLKVDFSLLSVSRENAAEQGFLTMLLNSEPDLGEYAGEPMVFPVFGQGRALWALVGKGINAENIFESCMFLTGPCSCQVKSMNPGTDMMMDFDWWGALEGRVPPPPEISPDMLTSVAPLLDDDAMDEPDRVATISEEIDGGHEPREAADSPEVAGAAPVRPAAPEGSRAPDTDSPGAGPPMFVVTGAVLGGLLLVVAAATAVLLGKRKE